MTSAEGNDFVGFILEKFVFYAVVEQCFFIMLSVMSNAQNVDFFLIFIHFTVSRPDELSIDLGLSNYYLCYL